MRTNMDPLTPTTSTLAPAISHIAETTATLSVELAAHAPVRGTQTALQDLKARKTVQWVLDTPERLEQLLLDDKREEAENDWRSVRTLLDKWEGTKGVEAIRAACEKALSDADA